MLVDRALQRLGEHVGMIFFGILVFHNDFPFSHPLEYFQVALDSVAFLTYWLRVAFTYWLRGQKWFIKN